MGSFITPDPARDGLNHYAYANSNPIRYTDPTGLTATDDPQGDDDSDGVMNQDDEDWAGSYVNPEYDADGDGDVEGLEAMWASLDARFDNACNEIAEKLEALDAKISEGYNQRNANYAAGKGWITNAQLEKQDGNLNAKNHHEWNVYAGLTPAERMLVQQHPFRALRINNMARRSLRLTEKLQAQGIIQGLHNGPADAFRHALWSSMISSRLGTSSNMGTNIAQAFTNAHEQNPNQPAIEQQMDFYNNSIGINIGSTNRFTSVNNLVNLVLQELNAGNLRYINNNTLVPTP